jgi:beta-mannanase
VWIRWGHEFNGNWYPWSTSANNKSPKDYIAAYRHIHSRFTRAGAFNVRWVWCINAETVPNTSWNDPLRAYPGDAYVDMISIDGYNFGTTLPSSRWQSFAEVFAVPYAKIVRRFPNKPLMINETACATVGGPTGTERDKAQWIRDMDTALRRTFPRISAVVWFETEKEADWRMVSSPATREASRRIWRQAYYRRGET